MGGATNEGDPSSMPQPQASAAGDGQQEPADQYTLAFHPPPLSQYYPSPFYPQPQSRPSTNEGGRPSSPVPMTYLPPPPPPLGNTYASPGYWHSQPGQQLYQSPFYSNQQTPNLAGLEGSPFGFQHEGFQHERSSSISQQMPGAGPGYVHPGGVYPYQMPSFTTQGNLGASIDGQRLPYYRSIPTHLGMQAPSGNKEGDLLSPSGVTASSMQVNPPSSPPSAPSVNMQPTTEATGSENQQGSTTNTNNNNTSSVLPSQPAGGSTVAAASGESQQDNPVAAGNVATAATAVIGSAVKSKEAARKEGVATGETGGEEGREDEDSMSSLPMSLPDKPL